MAATGSGSFAELENPLSTPESLNAIRDPERMLEHLRDDLAMQLAVYAGDPGYRQPGKIDELDRPKIERLAELLDFPFDWGTGSDQRQQAAMLLNRYGQRTTIFILDKVRAFTQSAGKTLLVVLNYTARPIISLAQLSRGTACGATRRSSITFPPAAFPCSI